MNSSSHPLSAFFSLLNIASPELSSLLDSVSIQSHPNTKQTRSPNKKLNMPSSIQQSHPAPINTSGRSSVSSDMGSPASDKSFSPLNSPLYEEPSEASSSVLDKLKTVVHPKSAGRSKSQLASSNGTTSSRRKSSDSIDSLSRRPTFNSYGSGRHSNDWLFRGISVRGAVRALWEPSSPKS